MNSKIRCDSCIFLNKKVLKNKVCENLGKNKGCPACKSWEPDLENISEKAKSIIVELGLCDDKDFPILRWVLDKQQILAENKLPYRIGETVYFHSHGVTYSIIIINASNKTITGRDIESDVSFILTNFNDIYINKEDLEKSLEEKKENTKKKNELIKTQLEGIFENFTTPPPRIHNVEGRDV